MRVKRPSAALVVAMLALVFALAGTAEAAYLITSNSQVGPGTISGHKPPSGDHANIISVKVEPLRTLRARPRVTLIRRLTAVPVITVRVATPTANCVITNARILTPQGGGPEAGGNFPQVRPGRSQPRLRADGGSGRRLQA